VIRLVATDLDGTLLRTDGTFSDRTIAALARVQDLGIAVVFVSARSPRTVPLDAARAGVRGFAVCGNGAITYDLAADRVVAHRPFPPEAVARLVTALREAAPGVAFGCELELEFGHEPAYLREDSGYPAHVLDALELARRPVTKLIAQHLRLPLPELLSVAAGVVGEDAVATISGTRFVELNAPGVTKAAAVEALSVDLGIESHETIAFGDNLNDIPLLGWAGRGVAVANAQPEVIAVADEVTSSNDEDGVAVVLESLP
jgi:HAD superfamily hydrolase (TIGR01484 family)